MDRAVTRRMLTDLDLARRTVLKAGAAATFLAASPLRVRPASAAACGADCTATTWGRINLVTPSGAATDAPFYADASGHHPNLAKYWLPDRPPDTMPLMQQIWDGLGKDGVTYDQVAEDAHSVFLPRQAPRVPRLASVQEREASQRRGRRDREREYGAQALSIETSPLEQSPPEPTGVSLSSLPSRSRLSTSPNWSGVYVQATSDRMLTRIVGRFTVPAVTRGPSNDDKKEYRSSVWVGFDGQGSYQDSSLPQVGVSKRLAAGSTTEERQAWFEWWENPGARRASRHRAPVYIDLSRFPIDTNDTILCWIDVIPGDDIFGHDMARIFLKNETKNRFILPFYVYAPALVGPKLAPVYPTVTGATANFIVERPSDIDKAGKAAGQFLMPAFASPVTFPTCLVGSCSSQIGAADREHTLDVSRRINLFCTPDTGGVRTETIGVTSRLSETSFQVAVSGM